MEGRWKLPDLWADEEKKDRDQDGGAVLQRPQPIPGLSEDPLAPRTIRAVRDRLSLTQQQLADLVGVSVRTIKAWEHPRRDASDARNCTGAGRKLVVLLGRHPDVVEHLSTPPPSPHTRDTERADQDGSQT